MTTIEQEIRDLLFSCGIVSENAADCIVESARANVANEAMQEKWQDRAADYPSMLIDALWLSTKHHALEWILENAPQAWYRPMFEEKE